MLFKQIFAVFLKDIRSELRTRYTISAVLLFVLTTITMIVFATADERMSNGLAAGVLWIIMFFSAMTGISRSFVSEEERGTSLLLRLSAGPAAVYFGKLLFNIVLALALNITASVLFFLFLDTVHISSPLVFCLMLLSGSLGIASATTIISAIIAKASTKGALFPVLSFPLLLPLIIAGIELTYLSFTGASFGQVRADLQMILSYCVVVVTVSYLLFDFVWTE